MNIQNDFLQQYHSITRGTKGNANANVQPDFQRNFDNYYNSLHDSNAGSASHFMPSAPPSVKDAWEKAEQEKEKLFYQKFIENLTVSQGAATAKAVSPAEIYEQMTGRAVSAGEASYNLSQEQIDKLKSRYDIENITAEDYQSLMKELAEMGVISKNEGNMTQTTEGGLEMIRRPIILGLYPQGEFKQNLSYDSFKKGDFLEWAQNLVDKYDNGIAWIMGSGKDYNNAKTNKENIESLQKFNDSVNRTLQVLNQLK